MPGLKLSNAERALQARWDEPPANAVRPVLKQVRIGGGPGLRGIRQLVVPLQFPFTAICGRNGVGKSTVLALTALSGKSPQGWRVYWGNTRPRTRPDSRVDYAFSDFFHRRAGDPNIDGLTLGWVYVDRGNEFEVVQERAGSRWRRVADVGRHRSPTRPTREVDYLPMSRVLPASEYGVVRSAFSNGQVETVAALGAEQLAQLSFIMGRQYEEASTETVRGITLPTCRSGQPYSGFDMGGGETSVITLLSRIQTMPNGGLLVIEEIELGLHAEAQARLVQVLIGICLRKQLQIICTTHSEVILDRLPRQARVLLRRSGDDHEALTGVSTRFAIHEMSGEVQPELQIYTEDRLAAALIEEALDGSQRARVRVDDIGSNATLARQAVSHLRTNGDLRALSVFDGDCTEQDIGGWVRSERGVRNELEPDWLILPGEGVAPEAWLLAQLQQDEYVAVLAGELNCEVAIARGHVASMVVEVDQHNSAFTLARRTGLDRDDAARRLVRSVARNHPALDGLRARVAQILG